MFDSNPNVVQVKSRKLHWLSRFSRDLIQQVYNPVGQNFLEKVCMCSLATICLKMKRTKLPNDHTTIVSNCIADAMGHNKGP